MSALDRFTDALEAAGSTGRGTAWQCPSHEDKQASLSVSAGREGVLVRCHAGCSTLDVLDALGLSWGALFDEPATGKNWSTSTLRGLGAKANGDGRVQLGAVRYLPGGSPKTLAVKGAKRDLWPDPATVTGDTLYVVEGEPDAVSAAQLGLPAVAVPGAGAWKSEWAERIARGRRRVVIVSDCDEPGRAAAAKWASAIAEHVDDVRLLDLEPGRTDGFDLGDWSADAATETERQCARRVLERALEALAPMPGAGATPAIPAPAAPNKLRELDLARMVREEPPPVPWVVEGLVVRGALTVLNGREGEGKSLLAMALAAGVATGQDEAGLSCERGGVLIIDGENGEGEIHRRVRTLDLPSANVAAFEAQGFDLRSDLGELERVLEKHRPDLLVLDSYRSLWGGEENDSREVAAVLDPLRNLVRSYGAGTLLLHHSGRSSGAYRGSSAIGASAELGFKLARAEDDPDRTRCYLETWKCRPAQKPPRRWLRLSVERGRVYIDEAEPLEREEPEREAPVREQLAPRVLAILTSAPKSRADIARAVERDPKDRSVGRVLDELVDSKRAERTSDGWRVAGVAGTLGGAATLPPPPRTRILEPEIRVAGGLPPSGGLPPLPKSSAGLVEGAGDAA